MNAESRPNKNMTRQNININNYVYNNYNYYNMPHPNFQNYQMMGPQRGQHMQNNQNVPSRTTMNQAPPNMNPYFNMPSNNHTSHPPKRFDCGMNNFNGNRNPNFHHPKGNNYHQGQNFKNQPYYQPMYAPQYSQRSDQFNSINEKGNYNNSHPKQNNKAPFKPYNVMGNGGGSRFQAGRGPNM